MGDEKAHAEQNRQDTDQDQDQNQNPRPASDAFSRLPSAGLIFLAFNTAVAVFRARDNPWPVAFVVLSFVDLLLLFYRLHRHVDAPPNLNSPRRRRHLRTAVWFLASFIIAMLSYRVADMTMLAAAWSAVALAVGLGLYCFSIYAPDSYFLPTDLKDDDICDVL